MAFLEDPRMRQRWNRISQTTETVTENAAAGIWSFGHEYVNPCLGSVWASLGDCTATCLGGREERARRARERQRARGNAEYSFDFYDDWEQDLYPEEQGGGILSGWRNEDWDRLLVGSGRRRGTGGEIQQQPVSKQRTMSYGTRGPQRSKPNHEEDPTIIPSTSRIGFLGRLPFRIGGTLRYKPSAANLKEHPGGSKIAMEGEQEPLLGSGDEDYFTTEMPLPKTRKRSGTAGSGDTSDSYRSRGDLFPSDGEGEEDAVPLDDDLAGALDYVDDHSSLRTRSSKGKRIASGGMARSASRTTMNSARTRPTIRSRLSSSSNAQSPRLPSTPSIEDLFLEEALLGQQEEAMIEKHRQTAANLALRRGLSRENLSVGSVPESKSEMVQVEEVPVPEAGIIENATDDEGGDVTTGAEPSETQQADHSAGRDADNRNQASTAGNRNTATKGPADEFVPARLPYFR